MGFKRRRVKKYKAAKEFTKRMKQVQEKIKTALEKA